MPSPDDTHFPIERLHRLFAVSALALLAVTVWVIAADHYRPWKAYQRRFRDEIEPGVTQAELRSLKEQSARQAPAEHRAAVERLERLWPLQQPNWGKRLLRLPLIDAFGRPLSVEQIWLPELTINYNFRQVARFDRCTTCHLGIDRAGPAEAIWSQAPQPFASHPRLDLFVGAQSPHPVAQFGCTICHDGQGSATDFAWAGHTPNDPAQRADWRQRHGWFADANWDYPMLPARFAESRCLKCHYDVTDLEPSPRFPEGPAPKLLAGYELVRQYGCFGCHQIQGFDDALRRLGPDMRLEPSGAQASSLPSGNGIRGVAPRKPTVPPGTMRKVGPSLRDVAERADAPFLESWIRRPAGVRPATRMPQLYGLHEHLQGQDLADAQRFEAVEVRAIGQYLLWASRPVKPLDAPPGVTEAASAERGKRLFQTAGCLACHRHREFPDRQPTQGPDLTNLGAQITTIAGRAWLTDWIRDPSRHSPRTTMPSLTLPGERQGRGASSDATEVRPKNDFPISVAQAFMPGTRSPRLTPTRFDRSATGGSVKSGGYMVNAAIPGINAWAMEKETRPGVSFTANSKVQTADPAADIAEWLLTSRDWRPEPSPPLCEADLDALTLLYLRLRFPAPLAAKYLAQGIPPSLAGRTAGDEELLLGPVTTQKKLQYVGRRTIRRRGCFGCHDIAGMEDAVPIAPALSDWGRKPVSQLAFEQIEAFVVAHGDRAGEGGDFFTEALLAHRREGFIWQKLRAPRSFDYQKTRNKGYLEQLTMGRFTLSDAQREAIITFILGLVAEPPAEKYVYHPDRRQQAIVEGQKLLEQFACAECHTLEMERWTIQYDPAKFKAPPQAANFDFLQQHLSPDILAASAVVDGHGLARAELFGMPRLDARGHLQEDEDDDGNPLYGFSLWEPAAIGAQVWPVGGAEVLVGKSQIVRKRPPLGGAFTRWLYPIVLSEAKAASASVAPPETWGWLPPALVHEGRRVQPEWLFNYLLSPTVIRPMAALRMPKFNLSPAEAGKLVDYFAAVDGVEFPYVSPAPAPSSGIREPPPRRDDARRLVLDRKTFCAKCHLIGDYAPAGENYTGLAPDLAQVGRRIRPEYLRRWLGDPQSVLPYTPMPVNFPPSGKPLGQDLYRGTSLEQLDAVMDFLLNYEGGSGQSAVSSKQ
jgi:cytochrome c551/c552